MQEIQTFFQNKRNIAALVVLLILILAIPLGIYLVKTTQVFKPKALGTGSITLAEGSCVTTDASGNKILTCKDVPLRLVVPSFPIPSPSPSPSPSIAVTPKRVFVTSATFTGNLGGLLGADQKCQAAADAANLGGSFKAWLSDDNIDASSRLAHSDGQYRLLDGTTVVAQNWTDLIDYSISSPINITEYKTPVDPSVNGVWTSTMPNGTKAQNSLACNNWTDASTYSTRTGGSTNYTNGNWTYWYIDVNYACSGNPLRLYCFEQ